MKNLITLITLIVFAFSAQATSLKPAMKIANVPFNYYENPTDRIPAPLEVTLYDNGDIIIENYTGLQFFGSTKILLEEDLVIELRDGEFYQLASMANLLHDIDVEEYTSQIICMMVPPPGATSDLSVTTLMSDLMSLTNELRVIHTQGGCWRGWSVTPLKQSMKELARELKSELIKIALEEIQE